MKNIVLLLAMSVVMFSCGSSTEATVPAADSSAVKVDTAKVDSTVKVDSTKATVVPVGTPATTGSVAPEKTK